MSGTGGRAARLVESYAHEMDVQLQGVRSELEALRAELREVEQSSAQELEALRAEVMGELKELLAVDGAVQAMPARLSAQVAQVRAQAQVLGQRLDSLEAFKTVKESQGWLF